MNKQESRRYAHGIAAGALEGAADKLRGVSVYQGSKDGDMILDALRALAEQHRRYGPKRADRAPRFRTPVETPLLDAIDMTP